jgi:hypothetical protein
MYRKATHIYNTRAFGLEQVAVPHGSDDDHPEPLPPQGCSNPIWAGGTCVWDRQHVCGPDVVAAAGWPETEFGLNGTSYQYTL